MLRWLITPEKLAEREKKARSSGIYGDIGMFPPCFVLGKCILFDSSMTVVQAKLGEKALGQGPVLVPNIFTSLLGIARGQPLKCIRTCLRFRYEEVLLLACLFSDL